MSKGLEALERLYCAGNLQLDYVCSNKHKEDYNIIEKELYEGEMAIINLDEIVNIVGKNYSIEELIDKIYNTFKALEIIKEKRLNIDEIYHKDYEWYLLDHKNDDKGLIPTKEEYELVKGIVENDY